MSERFLVTGALGCIGAWTVRELAREGSEPVAFDLGTDARRLRAIMSPDELARVTFVRGDISNLEALEAAIDEHGITNLIHLAALQVPFCREDPPRGAHVNVVGTVNVFEAAKRRRDRMAPVVYTSSIAVYSAEDVDDTTGRLTIDAIPHPGNHYGVYKLANEGNARIYWFDEGVPSIGLRPMTVYGVGRDQGMTSGPTKAIVAAVLGRRYTVPFRGATLYQYAADVALTLVAASRSGLDGAHVFNLAGSLATDADLIRSLEAILPGSGELIDFAREELPFPSKIDSDGLEKIGSVRITPFEDGVRASVEILRGLERTGSLVAAEHGLGD